MKSHAPFKTPPVPLLTRQTASAGRSASGGMFRGLAGVIEREFRRYLECDGFARVRCADCGHDFLIAYSCKGRGVCLRQEGHRRCAMPCSGSPSRG